MTMAKLAVIAKEEPAQDALASRRIELMAEAAKLNRVAEARAGIERRLQDLDSEQAALDEGERAAWRTWAENDAEGPPPSPRLKEREGIAQRRALIAGDLSGALAGQKAVEPRLAALHAELADIMLKLYERKVGELMDESEAINSAVHEAARAFVAVAEQADGLRDAVVAELERSVVGADREREGILRAAFARIEQLTAPKLAGDPEARSRHAADYRRRLA